MSDNKELIDVATKLKKEFLEAADDLDKHFKNVNIARISGSSVAIVGGGGAANTAATPARVALALASPMVIFNVILLGLNIYDLVDASLEIHKKKKSPAGYILRKLAEELDEIIQG